MTTESGSQIQKRDVEMAEVEFVTGLGDEYVSSFVATHQDLEALAKYWANEISRWGYFLGYESSWEWCARRAYAGFRLARVAESIGDERVNEIVADIEKEHEGEPSLMEAFHKRASISDRIDELLENFAVDKAQRKPGWARFRTTQDQILFGSYDDDPALVADGIAARIEEMQKKLAVLVEVQKQLPAAIEKYKVDRLPETIAGHLQEVAIRLTAEQHIGHYAIEYKDQQGLIATVKVDKHREGCFRVDLSSARQFSEVVSPITATLTGEDGEQLSEEFSLPANLCS